jgi:hypothetical protein
MFYSTTRNFLSRRDPKLGTPFVRAICEVFEKNVKNLSLVGMIHKISKKLMTSTEQVPESMDSMSSNFYFTKVSLIKILINRVKYSSKNLERVSNKCKVKIIEDLG